MTEAKRIVIPYTPRSVFLPYHQTDSRFVLTVAHRRAGKTVARINKLIRKAAECTKDSPRFGYLAPYYVQAKDIAWNYLKHYSSPILQIDETSPSKPNESELSIRMPHNNAIIRLYGAENIERLRGLYFDGIAADEAQDIVPSALTSVILPALADRQGWLDLSGTPKGWGNLLGQTYKRAQEDPDWFAQVLKASETGLIPQAELDRLRKSMPENEYLQEFECSFDAAITGAYYAKEISNLEFDGRICGVPYDKTLAVHTAWDLGVSDSTTIWFWQQAGREIRVIDYYEASGQGLDHYAGVLHSKDYIYGKHWGPHDINVREFGSGKSRLEIARNLGIRFDTVPNIGIKDGIDAARMMINRMWFDKSRCSLGLDALRQYQEKVDEKRGVALGPLHNWASHAADAFRYMCVAMQEVTKTPAKQRPQYGPGGWMG
jgi:phage terminase large subunit